MSKPKERFGFWWFIRWLMYHGDESPVRIATELRKQGFHDCHPCSHPLHPKNWKD